MAPGQEAGLLQVQQPSPLDKSTCKRMLWLSGLQASGGGRGRVPHRWWGWEGGEGGRQEASPARKPCVCLQCGSLQCTSSHGPWPSAGCSQSYCSQIPRNTKSNVGAGTLCRPCTPDGCLKIRNSWRALQAFTPDGSEAHYLEGSSSYLRFYAAALRSAKRSAPSLLPVLVFLNAPPGGFLEWAQAQVRVQEHK